MKKVYISLLFILLFLIIILGIIFMILYIFKKKKNQNQNIFDITQICQVVNGNCISQTSSKGTICFEKTKSTDKNNVTITFSNGKRNFSQKIIFDDLNSDEKNPNITLKIFTTTLGFFKYPCYICNEKCSNEKRIVCIINLSQSISQRLCYDMDTYQVFIMGPTTPLSTLQLS